MGFFFSFFLSTSLFPAHLDVDAAKKRQMGITADETIAGKEKKQKTNESIVQWEIDLFPNVTEITSISMAHLEFMARPAGQGKNTPIACFATEANLLELDSLVKVPGFG